MSLNLQYCAIPAISQQRSYSQLLRWADPNCSALYIYDYFLTLPLEIECIWTRNFSLGSYFFLVNRYAMLSYAAFAIVELASWDIGNSITDQVSIALLGRSTWILQLTHAYRRWVQDATISVCVDSADSWPISAVVNSKSWQIPAQLWCTSFSHVSCLTTSCYFDRLIPALL